ncbi:hypothetical protein D9757_008129 [Collybiopsis confluens]|uniref:Ribonucleases P/MRP subunit Pop8-like domain-containing protein n=1 Tax=Collybiopsis confluens TaxID=2823264 RepID=A0A8H5HEH4_9AGAR|nr:hypothetical protein D9757_008129 [Collybiopsis confluens]
MLNSNYHYLRLSLEPKEQEQLRIRYTIQQALLETFGITAGSIYLDILWVAQDGSDVVIRIRPDDARNVLAAATSWSSPKMQLVKESSFLPSLLSETVEF